MIARYYIMQAASGNGSNLEAALRGLATLIRALPESLGVEILQDCTDSDCFSFIERWESLEAHKRAGALLPKAALAPVMQALSKPPEGSSWNYLEAITAQ